MTVEDVIREMRDAAVGIAAKGYEEEGKEFNKWADAIEAEMQEKETWLSPETYDELMQERQETLHESAKKDADIERLNTALREIQCACITPRPGVLDAVREIACAALAGKGGRS